MFEYYTTGLWSLSRVEKWLSDRAFKARNKREDGPRAVTLYSVRELFHNPCFTGKVRHKDQTLRGVRRGVRPSHVSTTNTGG